MKCTEHTMKSWDGAELFYRAWLPATPAKKALLLFHRGHEHSARWQELVDGLALDDVAVFAWDARGHGRSPGERGSADNLGVVIKDVDVFVRHLPIARAREFILERFRQPTPRGDTTAYTQAEYERLRAPGGWHYALIKLGMKTLGRLSHGIRLGWRAGFDSGVMLDYVYENRPCGLFDRQYLNSIGWRGIRQRKVNLEKWLRETIQRVHAEGRLVRVLDIAAGAGRYVLETMRAMSDIPISAVLRDYKQENLNGARRLAEQLGLKNVTVVQGDAFDRVSLASTAPKPTIAIVSGLYELFPSNEPVISSLRGAGFEKLAQEIDQWGIFTVSVARRR